MPVRSLHFRGMGFDPYRNLQNRDRGVNGLAILGASLMNAPATRAAASKQAFNEEMKVQDGLFERQYKTGRAKADDRFKERGQDLTEARDRNTNDYRGKQLTEVGKGREARTATADADRLQRANDNEARLGVQRDGQVQRGDSDRAHLKEDQRHNEATEGIARDRVQVGPKQKEAALLATDMWNKARVGATEQVLENGVPVRRYDPAKHEKMYGQLRELSGRTDIPEWRHIQAAEKAMPQGAPAQPAAEPSFMTMRRSGQPGVKTLGDLTGGVVDGWKGEQPPALFGDGPAPKPPVSRPPAAGAQAGGGAPAPAEDQGLFGDQAAPAAQPMMAAANRVQSMVSRLHPDDQAAFQRILQTGDQKRIAAAMDRLQQMGAPAAPAGGYDDGDGMDSESFDEDQEE